jgi:hypothetical protein
MSFKPLDKSHRKDPTGLLVPVLFKISNSKAKTWRRCPKAYEYKYVHKLRRKTKSIPLEKGSWCHELLEAYYKGENWRKVHKRKVKEFKKLFEAERELLGDLPAECERLMLSYLRQYEHEDRNFRVIDTELNEYVTLPNGLRVQVIIDLVYEDSMGLWAMDHKFRGRFEDSENMRLDPQLTVYHWAAELLGYPLVGVVYNEVLTKPPTLPKLTPATGKLERRANLFCDPWTYAQTVKAHGFDMGDYADFIKVLTAKSEDKFFRRTYLPKDPIVVRNAMQDLNWTAQEIMAAEDRNRFPRTFDKSCKWCDYSDLCLTQYAGGDGSGLIKHQFQPKEQD